MKLDTNELISVTDASRFGVSKLVNDAHDGHERVVVVNNRPRAAIVGIETIERLRHLDEIEDDMRLLGLAWARVLTDSGRRHALDDVIEEFGIDLDDEE